MTTNPRTEDYLRTVLRLIERTQQGSLKWRSLSDVSREDLEHFFDIWGGQEALRALGITGAVAADIRDRAIDSLLVSLHAGGYVAEYEGKMLRLQRDQPSEGGSKRRAKLDVQTPQSETIDTFPQSAALDDLLRTVERRFGVDERSRLESGSA